MNKRIIFDIVLLAVFLLSDIPAFTGIPAHEWIGIACTVVLVIHCASRGAVPAGRNAQAGKTSGAKVARIVLNVLLLLALAVCAVSGIMVSGTVLPMLGLYAGGFFFWDPLHAFAAKVLLTLLLVHIVVNGRALFAMGRAMRSSRTKEQESVHG